MVSGKTVLLRFSFSLQCSNRVLFFIFVVLIFWKETIYIGLRVLLLLLVEPSLISVKLTNPYSIIICNVFGIIWSFSFIIAWEWQFMNICLNYFIRFYYGVPLKLATEYCSNGIAISGVCAHGAELFYFSMDQYLLEKKNCINNLTAL